MPGSRKEEIGTPLDHLARRGAAGQGAGRGGVRGSLPSPSPWMGEGWGGGDELASVLSPTPHPNPPPQGGREKDKTPPTRGEGTREDSPLGGGKKKRKQRGFSAARPCGNPAAAKR